MKRMLLAMVLVLAAAPVVAVAAPKPPSSPYPSCTGEPQVKSVVTRRVAGKASAGSIRFTLPLSCDHDQLSMSVSARLLKAGKPIGTTGRASCTFAAPDFSCAALTVQGGGSVRSAMAGRYQVEVTVTTTGWDYVVPRVQSYAGFWRDPCTKDETWTTVTCTSATTFTVS